MKFSRVGRGFFSPHSHSVFLSLSLNAFLLCHRACVSLVLVFHLVVVQTSAVCVSFTLSLSLSLSLLSFLHNGESCEQTRVLWLFLSLAPLSTTTTTMMMQMLMMLVLSPPFYTISCPSIRTHNTHTKTHLLSQQQPKRDENSDNDHYDNNNNTTTTAKKASKQDNLFGKPIPAGSFMPHTPIRGVDNTCYQQPTNQPAHLSRAGILASVPALPKQGLILKGNKRDGPFQKVFGRSKHKFIYRALWRRKGQKILRRI